MSSANPPSGERQTFRAVLTPHRSLSPSGFLILMATIVVVSFAVGVAFVSMGAWPIAGFFGLDVLLIYYAFRANYRSGRAYETVEITPETITITRVDPAGRSESFDFNTYWARCQLREEVSGRTRLSIVSHGKAFPFGVFLSDDDRRTLAEAIEAELLAQRSHIPT
jgi:uncharacterized membrane protein